MSSGVSACGFAVAEVFAGRVELARWLCLSPCRCRVRASGWPGSGTGRSPAGVAGAGGVLDAGAREPMIEACGERLPRSVSACVYFSFSCKSWALVIAGRHNRIAPTIN